MATIACLGQPGNTEYRIRVDSDELQLAALLLETTDLLRLSVWPAGSVPGSDTALITGPLPGRTAFDIGGWARVTLDPAHADSP